MRGTMPEVEMVMRRKATPQPASSARIFTAFITGPRFRSGSPCPMKTTFSRDFGAMR